MGQNSIKCPQCGAVHVNHVSQNKYSCPFCGHSFYVERESNFVQQETDEFKLAQEIERKELERSLAQKKKNRIIYALIGCVLFVPIVYLSVRFAEYIDNKFSDKNIYFDYDNKYDKISFLQQAPFESDGKTCVFSDYARKVTIDGTTYAVEYGNIRGEYYHLTCNSDSTIAYLEFGDEKYKRPIKNSSYRIFDFADEDALRKYLCEKSFEFMDDVFTFTKDAYTVYLNDYKVSDYIEYEFHNHNLWRYTRERPIESRAVIGIHHYGGVDILYLMMTEDGKYAYLLQHGSNKKYKRQN